MLKGVTLKNFHIIKSNKKKKKIKIKNYFIMHFYYKFFIFFIL